MYASARLRWRSCTIRSRLLMRAPLAPFARPGRDGAHDHAARDAVAGSAVRLTRIVVAFRIDDERCAVAVEDRLLAIADREGVADHACLKRPVARREFVGQI